MIKYDNILGKRIKKLASFIINQRKSASKNIIRRRTPRVLGVMIKYDNILGKKIKKLAAFFIINQRQKILYAEGRRSRFAEQRKSASAMDMTNTKLSEIKI